jgi:hypothetical protein
MRKVILIVVCALLLLSGCNFPGRSPTPEPDQISTAVQLTLSAVPAETLALPEETAVPTETAAPAEPTATPEPTATASPTPTGLPEDPRQTLGEPTGRDVLDSGSGFGLSEPYDDSVTRMYMQDGFLVLNSSGTGGWRSWRLRPPKLQNGYIEAVFDTQSCSNNDVYGITLRAPDFESGHGYYFGASCGGRFTFSVWTDAGSDQLVSGDIGENFAQGSGQVNRLGVLARGTQFELYVNGRKIETVENSDLADAGYYGPFISASSGNFVVALDEIAYWTLP